LLPFLIRLSPYRLAQESAPVLTLALEQ